jgi:hypothetical protein
MTVNLEELLHDTLQDWAAEAPRPPIGFAHGVLRARRRRRFRTIAATAVATAAVVTAAVTVPVLELGGDAKPAHRVGGPADVVARPDQSPPRELVAAGDTAMSAYYTLKWTRQPNGDKVLHYIWRLYDPQTGHYRKTRWAWVDVAPGMRTAAVLEGELPAHRVGLLDMATGKVERWIPLTKGVAGVAWSPDGRRLLGTTYARDPDRYVHDHPENVDGKTEPGPVESRTGFYVIDPHTGARWSPAPPDRDGTPFPGNPRADFGWSRDGRLVWGPAIDSRGRIYRDLDGRQVPKPPAEKYVTYAEAGLSPDGRLVGGEFAGSGTTIASAVLDARTGSQVGTVPVQQLLAWADDDRLIAWGCDPKKCSGTNEFRNQLLLVSLKNDKVIPLSGFRSAAADGLSRWTPEFTHR